MKKSTRMKEMLLDKKIAVVPSAYDGLSARVIQYCGFEALHLTGAGSSACLLGAADMGIATISEMATHAKNVVLSVDVPVIADLDTGFGNALNVYRCIQEYERAGLVGCHLEDQVTPKRCGHLDGKQLISANEMVGKIEAFKAARTDPDFLLIARTDARTGEGLDEAIRRANIYQEAGADCIFVESPKSADEMREIRKRVKGPLLANMVEGGKTPPIKTSDLEEMGYNIVIYPVTGWMGAAVTMRELMKELRATGTTQGFWERTNLKMSFAELFDILGYQKFREIETKYVRE